MAEILWDGFKNQKLLAERAYKDEHGNNIAETYAKKTELDDKVNTTAFDETIGEIDSELESIHDWAQDTFVSGDELSDYYKKSETSAADELAAEFLKYQPTGDYVTTEHLDETLEDYAQKDELTGYYTTDNPSGFLNIASAKAVGFATEDWVEEHDYAVSSDVDAALVEKLDTTAAAETYYPKTNPAGYISEIPSEYVTETELDSALSDYTKTDDLENLLEEKQDVSGMSEYVKNADMTGYYPSNNPSGFATQNWVEGKNYALSSDVNTELDKKLDITAADDKYYPLDENPAGYLVNTDLEPYASKTDLSALDTKIDEVSGKLDNLSVTVTALSDTVSDIDDSVEQVITDIESLDEAVDVYSGNIKFISGAVDFVSANVHSLDGYALSADVDTRLASKQDISGMTAYAQKTWVDSEYVSETELESALDEYYTKNETSAADELADEFKKYQLSGDYVTTASLESTLSEYATQEWAEDTFLTAVPVEYALSADVDTRLADKLDENTADSRYYPLNENPAGYITAHQSLVDYALSADVDTRLDRKVDKIDGKGLSTNDYTTVDKNRLDEAWGVAHTHSNKSVLDNITAPYTTEEKTKLNSIEASAQVNVQSDWEQADSTADDYIKNKPAELSLEGGEGIEVTEIGNTLTIAVSADYATSDDISTLSDAIESKVDLNDYNVDMDNIDDVLDGIVGDIDFISGAVDANTPVQSDWTEDDQTSLAYIKNKPNELSLAAGTGIGITETAGNIEIYVSGSYAFSADVDTRLGDKLDTTVAATTYYQKTNPENYEENVIDDIKIAGTSMTISNKSVNFDMIPSSADSSNPLVTKTDLAAAIANFGGFKVSTGTGSDMHPDESNPDTKTIYLVKDSTTVGSDKYKEWICTDTTTSPVIWELIGDTSLDLNGYVQFPASYTAGNIVTFGTNSIADCGYTTAQMVNVQPDWEQTVTGADDYIKNKPESLELVAGTYVTITGVNNQLTIDADVPAISGAMTGYANVQSDWNETNSTSDTYIANKPDIIIPQVGAGVSAIPKYIMVVTAMPPAAQIDPNTIYLVQGTYIGT